MSTINLSIVYFSQTGKTKEMAQEVAKGMRSLEGIEVGVFDLDHIDREFLAKSKAVVFGTPTYLANTCWQMKKWFDEMPANKISLGGKIGAAFATANYVQGGADTAILTLVNHMLVAGMLVYSSGGSMGQPYIHLGAVAVKDHFEESKPLFFTFGQRIATKAMELFNCYPPPCPRDSVRKNKK